MSNLSNDVSCPDCNGTDAHMISNHVSPSEGTYSEQWSCDNCKCLWVNSFVLIEDGTTIIEHGDNQN